MQRDTLFTAYPDGLSDTAVSALRVVSNVLVVVGVVIWTFVLPARSRAMTTMWGTDLSAISVSTQLAGLGLGLACIILGGALAFLFLGEEATREPAKQHRDDPHVEE